MPSAVTDGRSASATMSELARLMAGIAGASRIVFDLDGTLYDVRDFERPALASVADWLRTKSGQPLDGLSNALWARRESDRHRPGLFDDLLSMYGLPVSWGAECARRFHGYPGLELARAESLKEQLEGLIAQNRRLAMVSNGYPELQMRKLHLLGLAGLFDVCVYCDPREPDQLKPSVWGWTQVAAWRSAETVVYVGDDPVDRQFAMTGNVPFVEFSFRSRVYED